MLGPLGGQFGGPLGYNGPLGGLGHYPSIPHKEDSKKFTFLQKRLSFILGCLSIICIVFFIFFSN